MALTTASDYIYQALRRCGQLRPGYASNTELMADALDAWRIIYDGFNAKRTMQYTMPDYVFPVTGPGTGTTGNGQTFGGTGYTIGPTGDFVAARPESIVRMNLYMTSASPSQPTRIPISLISMEQWMNIAVIQLTAINVTTTAAYDPQWPNGVIWVWPPLNGNSLEIFTWGQLTPPATVGASYSAPPGYAEVIIWELAKELWPLATRTVWLNKLPFQYICGRAKAAKDAVRAVNAPMPKLRNDFDSGQSNTNSCSWSLLLEGTPY
jgi:hypothetical protein